MLSYHYTYLNLLCETGWTYSKTTEKGTYASSGLAVRERGGRRMSYNRCTQHTLNGIRSLLSHNTQQLSLQASKYDDLNASFGCRCVMFSWKIFNCNRLIDVFNEMNIPLLQQINRCLHSLMSCISDNNGVHYNNPRVKNARRKILHQVAKIFHDVH